MRYLSIAFTLILHLAIAPAHVAVANQRTPQEHAALLAAYEVQPSALMRKALEGAIDKASAQRYGYLSKLYWYTNLDEARAAARAEHKPILSLRLLGKLDEELTCANSRFFRVMYYANKDISAYLRQHYILHWSSERPAPKVTVDFGDGRIIKTTVTGNSIHYVLDEQGRVLDYIPNVQTPAMFLQTIARAADLWQAVQGKPRLERQALALAYHERRAGQARQALSADPLVESAWAAWTLDAQLDAQSRGMTKAMVERPITDMILPRGIFRNPSQLEISRWTEIGRALATRGSEPNAPATTLFDESSLALIRNLQPDVNLDALTARVFADAAISELVLRVGIDQLPTELRFGDMEKLSRAVYDDVFLTRGDDPWLNMKAMGGFNALPQH